jgi:hypothetical protein
MPIEQRIFEGRTNTNTLVHETAGVPTVWTGISHMVLDLIAIEDGLSDVQLSTNTAGQENTVDFSVNGFLVFILGDKNVAAGSYLVQLAAISSSNEKTQILHPDRDNAIFVFSNTKTVT